MPLQGHCNCNAVQITLQDLSSGDAHQTIYCHCITCKRQSGASGTYVISADESLVDIQDPKGMKKVWKDDLTDSGTPADRFFCGQCGCPIITTSPLMPGKVVVKMGLFEQVPRAVLEIYTKNMQSWETPVEGAKTTNAAP